MSDKKRKNENVTASDEEEIITASNPDTVAESNSNEEINVNGAVADETKNDGNEVATEEGDELSKEAKIGETLKNFENRTIERPKRHKFGWLGYVFLVGVIAVGIWLLFKIVGDIDGDMNSLGEALSGGSWLFGLISLGVLLLIIALDWLKYSVVMRTTTGKFNPRTSLKVALLGKFYDNVTPFAVGGQPMQIYYLHKKGLSGGASSAVILIRYFAQMFSCTIMCLIIMAACTGVLSKIDLTWQTVITVGAWVGLFVNMSLPIMIIFFVLLPKMARKLSAGIVGLGAKMKIVKDREATMAKAEKVVSDFRAGFAIMSKKPLSLIVLVLSCIIETFLTFSLPYFVMRAFSALPLDGGGGLFMTVVALNVYCTQAVAIVPTPGNSGAIEGVLVKAYLSIAVTASLSWALFTWRFSVYYIYIVIGMCLVVYELIRKIYRAQKRRRLEKADAALDTANSDAGGNPNANINGETGINIDMGADSDVKSQSVESADDEEETAKGEKVK